MFEWNAEKAARNERKHAVPFELAAAVFDDPLRIESDVSRERDGEERRKTVGRVGNRLFAVVFTMRGAVRRLISARRTNDKEERLYVARSQDAR
jgi:uncharacterized DUF497 family protein